LTSTSYYIDPISGSDANNGSIGSPWQTIQHAWNWIQQKLNLQGNFIIINLVPGTYSGATLSGTIIGQSGPAYITFRGNTVSPENYIIQGTSTNAITVTGSAQVAFEGVTFAAAGTGLTQGIGLLVSNSATCWIAGVRFGQCDVVCMEAAIGGYIFVYGNLTIVSNSDYAMLSDSATIDFNIAVTIFVSILGGSTFAGSFVAAYFGGTVRSSISAVSYSGTAFGIRYSATFNGIIDTNGGDSTYFPGSDPGVEATGGIYL
jgi:hypothetical protein